MEIRIHRDADARIEIFPATSCEGRNSLLWDFSANQRGVASNQLGLVLVLMLSLAFTVCAGGAENELVTNGNFASLDDWNALPEATVTEPNSPFQDTYPDNGKSAFLKGAAQHPHRYIAQQFLEAEGIIRFQFDFCLSDDGDSKDASWVVTLERAGKSACYVHVSGRRIGVLGQTDSRQKTFAPVVGTWHHFTADINLIEGTISWQVISADGDERDLEIVLLDSERFTDSTVDTVAVRQNLAKGVTHSSLQVDNISVRKLP